jgi:hypothetical protein
VSRPWPRETARASTSSRRTVSLGRTGNTLPLDRVVCLAVGTYQEEVLGHTVISLEQRWFVGVLADNANPHLKTLMAQHQWQREAALGLRQQAPTPELRIADLRAG